MHTGWAVREPIQSGALCATPARYPMRYIVEKPDGRFVAMMTLPGLSLPAPGNPLGECRATGEMGIAGSSNRFGTLRSLAPATTTEHHQASHTKQRRAGRLGNQHKECPYLAAAVVRRVDIDVVPAVVQLRHLCRSI